PIKIVGRFSVTNALWRRRRQGRTFAAQTWQIQDVNECLNLLRVWQSITECIPTSLETLGGIRLKTVVIFYIEAGAIDVLDDKVECFRSPALKRHDNDQVIKFDFALEARPRFIDLADEMFEIAWRREKRGYRVSRSCPVAATDIPHHRVGNARETKAIFAFN